MPLVPLSLNQRRFMDTLVYEFFRELSYMIDTLRERSTRRKDFSEKVLSFAFTVVQNLSFSGSGMLGTGASMVLEKTGDYAHEERLNIITPAYLSGQFNELNQQVKQVAFKASIRYRDFLNTKATERGAITLAQIGVRRIWYYLSHKSLPFTVENMLQGLLEGQSGKLYDGLADNPIETIFSSTKYHAEGVFKRSGIVYAEKEAWQYALPERDKNAENPKYGWSFWTADEKDSVSSYIEKNNYRIGFISQEKRETLNVIWHESKDMLLGMERTDYQETTALNVEGLENTSPTLEEIQASLVQDTHQMKEWQADGQRVLQQLKDKILEHDILLTLASSQRLIFRYYWKTRKLTDVHDNPLNMFLMRKDLANTVAAPVFLAQFLESDKKMWLITGEAQSGKTRLASSMEKYFWEKKNSEADWTPLVIRLGEIPVNFYQRGLSDAAGYFIENYLKYHFALTTENITPLKSLKWLLILDGLEECSSSLQNRFLLGEETKTWLTTKVVFTTRYDNDFSSFKQNFFEEAQLRPLKKEDEASQQLPQSEVNAWLLQTQRYSPDEISLSIHDLTQWLNKIGILFSHTRCVKLDETIASPFKASLNQCSFLTIIHQNQEKYLIIHRAHRDYLVATHLWAHKAEASQKIFPLWSQSHLAQFPERRLILVELWNQSPSKEADAINLFRLWKEGRQLPDWKKACENLGLFLEKTDVNLQAQLAQEEIKEQAEEQRLYLEKEMNAEFRQVYVRPNRSTRMLSESTSHHPATFAFLTQSDDGVGLSPASLDLEQTVISAMMQCIHLNRTDQEMTDILWENVREAIQQLKPNSLRLIQNLVPKETGLHTSSALLKAHEWEEKKRLLADQGEYIHQLQQHLTVKEGIVEIARHSQGLIATFPTAREIYRCAIQRIKEEYQLNYENALGNTATAENNFAKQLNGVLNQKAPMLEEESSALQYAFRFSQPRENSEGAEIDSIRLSLSNRGSIKDIITAQGELSDNERLEILENYLERIKNSSHLLEQEKATLLTINKHREPANYFIQEALIEALEVRNQILIDYATGSAVSRPHCHDATFQTAPIQEKIEGVLTHLRRLQPWQKNSGDEKKETQSIRSSSFLSQARRSRNTTFSETSGVQPSVVASTYKTSHLGKEKWCAAILPYEMLARTRLVAIRFWQERKNSYHHYFYAQQKKRAIYLVEDFAEAEQLTAHTEIYIFIKNPATLIYHNKKAQASELTLNIRVFDAIKHQPSIQSTIPLDKWADDAVLAQFWELILLNEGHQRQKCLNEAGEWVDITEKIFEERWLSYCALLSEEITELENDIEPILHSLIYADETQANQEIQRLQQKLKTNKASLETQKTTLDEKYHTELNCLTNAVIVGAKERFDTLIHLFPALQVVYNDPEEFSIREKEKLEKAIENGDLRYPINWIISQFSSSYHPVFKVGLEEAIKNNAFEAYIHAYQGTRLKWEATSEDKKSELLDAVNKEDMDVLVRYFAPVLLPPTEATLERYLRFGLSADACNRAERKTFLFCVLEALSQHLEQSHLDMLKAIFRHFLDSGSLLKSRCLHNNKPQTAISYAVDELSKTPSDPHWIEMVAILTQAIQRFEDNPRGEALLKECVDQLEQHLLHYETRLKEKSEKSTQKEERKESLAFYRDLSKMILQSSSSFDKYCIASENRAKKANRGLANKSKLHDDVVQIMQRFKKQLDAHTLSLSTDLIVPDNRDSLVASSDTIRRLNIELKKRDAEKEGLSAEGQRYRALYEAEQRESERYRAELAMSEAKRVFTEERLALSEERSASREAELIASKRNLSVTQGHLETANARIETYQQDIEDLQQQLKMLQTMLESKKPSCEEEKEQEESFFNTMGRRK